MSTWTGKGGPNGASGSEFVHVDRDGHAGSSTTSGATDKSGSAKEREQKPKGPSSGQRGRNSNGSTSSSGSSTNWQSTINRLTDQTVPEDQAAIRRLAEDVRKAGASGAHAVVSALRTRMTDKNSTPETRMRSISVARVLAQRALSGGDAQRQIAAPPFVNALRSIASDPNVRASLKTWASQIRIGEPGDASELAPITGLDEHLTAASDAAASQPPRRPPANAPGTASFQGRPQLSTTEEVDEDLRDGLSTHSTSGPFGGPMPGGFGLDGSAFDANGSVTGGPAGSIREFPTSSIQGIPPHLIIPQLGLGGMGGAHPASGPVPGPGWGEDEDGIQSDAPSTRSRRTAKTKAQPAQSAFGATPSMDGGREARSRLSNRTPRHQRSGSTLSSSLVDGTLSEPESVNNPAAEAMMYARHHGTGIPVPPGVQVGPMPTAAPQVMHSHPRSASPDPVQAPRRRSPSPVRADRSRMASRARAQSRRRPPAADPAAMLIELTGVQFVRARQDYHALREDELSLNEGDVLAVIKREADGRYWLGHTQGQVGRFPVHVVEVLSHQARPAADSAAQEEKTAELLRRAREIDDFMEHLHEFDITRQCITEDDDIQTDLASLLELRREVVRHLDETTTGIGRLKAMLNQIKQAQRVHDRMIDSRIAGYTARTAIHDETPRMNYQDLPANMGYQYPPPFDMSPYTRRTSGPAPQQIEQAPPRATITRGYSDQRGYNDPAATIRYRQAQEMGYPHRPAPPGVVPPRARTYSYAPAATPTSQRSPDDSVYATEPSTPGEPLTAGGTNGQPTPSTVRFPFPPQHGPGQNGAAWGEGERAAKDEVEPATRAGRTRGGSHIASETSGHTHTSRRGVF